MGVGRIRCDLRSVQVEQRRRMEARVVRAAEAQFSDRRPLDPDLRVGRVPEVAVVVHAYGHLALEGPHDRDRQFGVQGLDSAASFLVALVAAAPENVARRQDRLGIVHELLLPYFDAKCNPQGTRRHPRKLLGHPCVKGRHSAGRIAHHAGDLGRIQQGLTGRRLRTKRVDQARKHGGKQLAFIHPAVCVPVDGLVPVVTEADVVIPIQDQALHPDDGPRGVAGRLVGAAAGGNGSPE